MNTWGSSLRLSIFGESHGEAVGIVVDGIPAGEAIDMNAVESEMRRRAPGRSEVSTARVEEDRPDVLSGLLSGKTTGAPICCVISNNDARASDYDGALRPGHADMTALIKYRGNADMRGGGHFSGRLTAPLVFAGALAKQILARRGVSIHARIARIADVTDAPPSTMEEYANVASKHLAVSDDETANRMSEAILRAKEEGDSVGGVVECAAFGVPAGLGEPFFRPAEAVISGMLYAIPAVKGVEFGDGFGLAVMRGSEANDEIIAKDGELYTATNHNGGILGGITNGMPLVARVAIKPTPSIAREQRTADAATFLPTTLKIRGRHDPCIVPRVVPVVEAAVAVCILDMLLEAE